MAAPSETPAPEIFPPFVEESERCMHNSWNQDGSCDICLRINQIINQKAPLCELKIIFNSNANHWRLQDRAQVKFVQNMPVIPAVMSTMLSNIIMDLEMNWSLTTGRVFMNFLDEKFQAISKNEEK